MERLTNRDGVWRERMDSDRITRLYKQLAAYENTGFTPEDFDELCRFMSETRIALGIKTFDELRGEMTNYDRVMCMTAEELAEFLKEAECRPPWDDAFVKAFCYKCKTETVTVTDEPKRTLEVHPCDITDGECPHGSDIAWWLAQRAPTKEGKNRES